jgi:hypothetical protein
LIILHGVPNWKPTVGSYHLAPYRKNWYGTMNNTVPWCRDEILCPGRSRTKLAYPKTLETFVFLAFVPEIMSVIPRPRGLIFPPW